MANPIRTSLDLVLLAVRAQLVTRLAWPAERVLLVDPADLDGHPHGDQYLCLWPDLEQTALFEKLFGLRAQGLQLPISGSTQISDSLVT